LAAYDAENLSRQLWHNDMAAGQRDALGYFAKFNPPAGTTRRMPSRWRVAVKAGPQYGPLRLL
jgi:hypothetical protein